MGHRVGGLDMLEVRPRPEGTQVQGAGHNVDTTGIAAAPFKISQPLLRIILPNPCHQAYAPVPYSQTSGSVEKVAAGYIQLRLARRREQKIPSQMTSNNEFRVHGI